MSNEHATEQVDRAQPRHRESDDDLAGQLLSGRYRIGECLGRGAMGAVYRAEHTLMRKTVAVKVLRPQVGARGELVERFRREAQAAANIDHPNICSASDFGQMDDGTFFLVIEYLEGRTLEELLEQHGPLSGERALHIAHQICNALQRAHCLDVVHRDLKPENIMLVERDGEPDFVKILDFGVARVRLTEEHDEAELTQAGSVWGTPCYMSPEQASGGEVDGRSDLYSLGVILYEMLAGEPPFADDNPARVMAMHLTEPPAGLEQAAADADIAPSLARLVMRLLEKDRQARPASAAALADAFEAVATSGSLTDALDRVEQRPRVARPQDSADPFASAMGFARRWWTWLASQNTLTQGIFAGATAALVFAMLAVPAFVAIKLVDGPTSDVQRESVERDLADERARFFQKAGLTSILDDLEAGRTTAALDALDAIDEAYAESPHTAYLRGRVNGARGRWQAALEAYEEALIAEPLYANDTFVIDHVFERFSDPSDQRASRARAIIADHLDAAYASRKLAEMATFGNRSRVRKRAYGVLDETGRLADLEAVDRLGIELRHTSGCKPRKRIIADIVDEGDPRALDILREFANKGRTGCGFLKLEDCYGCIRGDLKDAIDHLESAER